MVLEYQRDKVKTVDKRHTMSYGKNTVDLRPLLKNCLFEYDPTKNRKLETERGVSLEEIVGLINKGKLISATWHHNPEKYPNQILCEVEVKGYIYVVPTVVDGKRAFLKTAYPSRKATKKHRDRSVA